MSVLLSIAAMSETNKGGRPYMEDYVAIEFEQDKCGGQGFMAVFDGHGGKDASSFACNHLWENIKRQKDFESKDPSKVIGAIRQAFRETQNGIWKAVDSWPSARPGVLSTAGTTVSACVIRGRDLYVGHLGDSGIVLAKKRADKDKLVARSLTVDHKPESESEKNRIESAGGEVRLGNGRVHRVVWNRIRQPHCGPVLRSTERESVPFLSVARSLGDLWSYNYEKDRYVVSPEPDVSFRRIRLETDRFLVFASDGLWAVMSHQEAVDFVARHRRESDDVEEDDENGSRVCSMLVQEGLQRWKNRSSRADNISVILAFFHEPKKNAAVKAATATEPEPAGATQSLERGISVDDVVVPPTPPTQDVDVVPTTTTTTLLAQKRKRKRNSASKNQKKRKVELLSSSKMPELSNG